MNCHKVQKSMSAFLDEGLDREIKETVSQHLARCPDCGAGFERLRYVRSALQSLPMAGVPPHLTSELRVLASHERMRQLAYRTLGSALRYWGGKLRLSIDNLMRPMAIPFAGGLVSALFLFSMLMPSLGFMHNFRNDVAIPLYTEATVIERANEDLVV